jgi:hypothetical protein
MKTAHKRNELLTDAQCLVCEDATQLRSIQLHKIMPTPLTNVLPGIPCVPYRLQVYRPLHSSGFPIKKIPQH